MKRLLASLLVISASGCPDVTADKDEGAGQPYIEYDPARSSTEGARYLPFPTDLARDARTGKVALGLQACESQAAQNTRIYILNALDGFGTYETPMEVTFSEDFDMATVEGNVALLKVGSFSQPIPIALAKTTMYRQHREDCSTAEPVPALIVVPKVPLAQHTQYLLAVKKGIRTPDGRPFAQSLTFALVSSKKRPVTIDASGNVVEDRTPLDPNNPSNLYTLNALNGLWKSLEAPLLFLDTSPFFYGLERKDLIVASAFTTQTTTDPLDQSVANSPASLLPSTPFLVAPSALSFGTSAMALCTNGEGQGECIMELGIGGCAPTTTGCSVANYNAGRSYCQAPPAGVYDCAQVGSVLVTAIGSINFQTQVPQSGAGLAPLQGSWSDPYHPAPQGALTLGTLISTPTGSPPASGWPVVIFGHGLASDKTTLFAIAGRLARMGFAAVAIDFSQHGSRAVRTSSDPALGCKGKCYTAASTVTATSCDVITDCSFLTGETCGTQDPSVTTPQNPPSPTGAPQCYASIFSTDLTNTRDNLRQSVLDLQRVAKALKACGTANCGTFKVDATKIYYGGLSLGSIIGAPAAAMSPDIVGAALNVPAAGLLDVIENTATGGIAGPLVNGLIDAGILTGTKWTPTSTDDIWTTGAWKMQPGYGVFSATARWVLDSADPANFVVRLRKKPVLLQEAVGDTVLPNITQEREGAILGLMPVEADVFTGAAPLSESAAISTDPTKSKYVTYTTMATATPPRVFVHSSLLRPYKTSGALATGSSLGTMREQIDFAQFLDNINGNNH